METNTTDVCEWCKRPLLPPGAKVAAKKPQKAAAPTAPVQPPPPEASSPPDSSDGLTILAAGSEPSVEQESAPPSSSGDADLLRPLGSAIGGPSAKSSGQQGPSLGTSVDMSAYAGADRSVLEPMARPQASAGGASSRDLFAARRKAAREAAAPEITENVRLGRAVLGGTAVALPITIIQFVVTKKVPPQFLHENIKIAHPDSIAGALMYGVLLSILLGGMLGALLVRLKWGPIVGLICGLLLGWASLQNGVWGLVAGGLAGIVVGSVAAKGAKRVMSI